ncbi:ketosteroid isomerase-like protein [Nocardioides sp. BE266]|uniref:nuclear transport factor 2 family protein n=1 Tax=Nocardioides sp. BE266 TaxID=2817725 RepID=UPI0028659E3C|nr:nuclear transport factor 2 family protein [Nocardioides sp. BE266]MDR7251650.1 ketosteroid isomerase-like protein [Nocardioides sp. BE266]
MTETLGSRLAHAIATKDEAALRALLADDVDFKGLTPRRLWEGTGPDDVVETVFGSWFEPSDTIERVVAVSDGDEVVDTAHVSYRFELANPDGEYVAEQQAYYRGDGTISHLRIMCSGFRPRSS